jgi:hypothetical protein
MATSIPNSSTTMFKQSWAPVKWTKQTTLNDYALRVTSTLGPDTNTGSNFSVAFNQELNAGGTLSVNATIGSTSAPFSSHSHTMTPNLLTGSTTSVNYGAAPRFPGLTTITTTPGAVTGSAGSHSGTSFAPHTHTFTELLYPFVFTNQTINIKYIDIIIATRTG